jgi:methylmalonyl-CoA/ethylmalonyl-CoA epimerase
VQLLQVAQRATDLDRAAAFYELLLGTPPTGRFEPAGLLFFRVGNTRLLLEEQAASALVYIQVDDLEATIARLREAGVIIESEPHVIFTHEDDGLGPAGMTEWQAFIRDSEGNLVGLASMVPAQAAGDDLQG